MWLTRTRAVRACADDFDIESALPLATIMGMTIQQVQALAHGEVRGPGAEVALFNDIEEFVTKLAQKKETKATIVNPIAEHFGAPATAATKYAKLEWIFIGSAKF